MTFVFILDRHCKAISALAVIRVSDSKPKNKKGLDHFKIKQLLRDLKYNFTLFAKNSSYQYLQGYPGNLNLIKNVENNIFLCEFSVFLTKQDIDKNIYF